MTEKQKHDMARIVMSSIQLQSVIHTLDEIEGTNEFKFKKKQEYSQLLNQINKFIQKHENELSELCSTFGSDGQIQNYVDCVNEFDKLAREIQVVI